MSTDAEAAGRAAARARLGQVVGYGVAVVFVAMFAWQFLTAPPESLRHLAGIDLQIYSGAAQGWLHGDGFYLDRQLHGPYPIQEGDVLYPPTWLFLFVPASVAPWPLWWLIPLGTMTWVLVRLRPSPLGWATIAAFLAWPPTASLLLTGNPGIWLVAALALATIHRWPAVLLVTKVTVAPLALFGIRDRRWWIGLLVIVGLSPLFMPMWPDYIRVLLDAKHPAGILYSVQDLPMYMIPLVAWATSRRRATAALRAAAVA